MEREKEGGEEILRILISSHKLRCVRYITFGIFMSSSPHARSLLSVRAESPFISLG